MTTDKARWMADGDGTWACFRVERGAAQALVQRVREGRQYALEVREQKKKRSLDANSYFWALLDKLAAVLGTEKEELYLGYVKEVGLFRDFHLPPEEVPTFREAWSRLGTGWPTEQVDYTKDGEQVVIRAYYGSSQYSTRRMSRLIDRAVRDCRDAGIETLPPEKLALLKEAWHAPAN